MNVHQEVLQEIARIIKKKCEVIGRSWLKDVEVDEITQVRHCWSPFQYVITVRQMTYSANIVTDRFGTFDPVQFSGLGKRTIASRSHLAGD